MPEHKVSSPQVSKHSFSLLNSQGQLQGTHRALTISIRLSTPQFEWSVLGFACLLPLHSQITVFSVTSSNQLSQTLPPSLVDSGNQTEFDFDAESARLLAPKILSSQFKSASVPTRLGSHDAVEPSACRVGNDVLPSIGSVIVSIMFSFAVGIRESGHPVIRQGLSPRSLFPKYWKVSSLQR